MKPMVKMKGDTNDRMIKMKIERKQNETNNGNKGMRDDEK